MTRSIVIILSIVFLAATAAADDFTTYRNSAYKYAIIYPSGWKIARDDGKVFSVLNTSKDVNINVVAEELEPNDRRRYAKITDVPNYKEEMTALIKQRFKTPSVESGTTILSNEPALWLKYYYIHRALDVEVYFVVYQIQILKNDITYTIGAKVSGMSREQADTKFKKYWPTIKTSMASFTLTDLVK